MVLSPGMNNCEGQIHKFLLVDDITVITSVSVTYDAPPSVKCSTYNNPIVECSINVTVPKNSNIDLIILVSGTTKFIINPKCIDPLITDYKIYSNSNESRIDYLINNQTINGPSNIIWFESGINNDNPPFFENLNLNSSYYSSDVVFLKKSKRTGLSIYRISFSFNSFQDYFKSYTTSYTANGIVKYYQVDSPIKPTIVDLTFKFVTIYPNSKKSYNNIISFVNITYDKVNDPSTGIVTLTNSGRIFPVSSIGKIKTFLNYFNLNYGNSPFSPVFEFTSSSTSQTAYFDPTNGPITLNYQNITLNKEMDELFYFFNTTTNEKPNYYTFVFGPVPPLPSTPIVVEYTDIGWKRELYFNQYPFALKNGINAYYQIVFSSPISNYFKGQLTFYVNSKPIRLEGVSQKIIDIIPPEILSSKYTSNIGNMKIVVEISIYDQQSGFSTYICLDDNSEIFNYKSISSGTIQNGKYTFIYDYGFQRNCSKSAFIDFAGNSLVVNQPFLDYIVDGIDGSKFFIMNQLPITSSFGLDDIKLFKFKYYNVDLTNKGCYNTLFFNFKSDNYQDYMVKMKLTIADWWTTTNEYYSYWDNVNGYYKIDFYIPPNLLPINIQYSLIFGLDENGLEYTTQDIESVIGNDATLSVFSEYGDMMAPFVTMLSYPQFTNMTELNQDTILIWVIEITDHLNGFDKGEITFVNSVDLFPITFNFESSASNSKISNYTFKIPVSKSCSSSYYEIRHLKLFDKSGIFSEYNYTEPQIYPIIDPLVKFSDVLNHAKIECLLADWTAVPILNNLEISKSSIDAGGLDSERVITFKAYISSIYGIRKQSFPTIYLGDNYLNYVKVPMDPLSLIFDQDTNEYIFTTSYTIPYGFGYPGGIYLNIFGILSEKSTFQGYSTLDLVNYTQKSSYFIDVPNFTIHSPKLLSTSPISNLGGSLTIYGRHLFNEGATISIQYSNLTEINITPIQFSGLAIKCNVRSTNDIFTVGYYDKDKMLLDVIVVKPYIDYWNSTLDPTPTPSSTPIPTNPPKRCSGNPECGGIEKGYCVEGIGCVCISPNVGESCGSRVIILPPPIINPNQPSINLTTESQGTTIESFISLISLNSLREINIYKSVVKSYKFDKWILESSTKTTSNYKTNITDPNDSSSIICQVSVSTIWYETNTTIEFAGQKLIMNPSTLKYNINITSYPFESNLNTLELVMSATAKTGSKTDDTCSSKEIGDTTSIDNSNFIQLSVNKHSLYSRFVKRAIVDGSIVSIQNVEVKDLSSSSEVNSYFSSQAFIGIEIPNFKHDVLLDPDFSVLLNGESSNSLCKDHSSRLSKGAIIGVVVGTVGGAIIIIILILLFIKYKYYIKSIKIRNVIKLNKY